VKDLNRKHIYIYRFLRPLVVLYLKLCMDYHFEIARNLPEQYIVLSNHATDYDPLLVGASFPKQMYFVASEHIARWGFLSKVINYLLAPIMRPKGASATAAVMEMLRRIRQGHNVAFFPEGVRTWDGCTSPIARSTAKLVKNAGFGLVTYKLTGGYFASPMWGGAAVRRGPVRGSVVNVYTKEHLSEMSLDQIYEIICRDLQEDAYARQMAEPKRYRSRLGAKHLENLLFICPECGAHDSFRTVGDRVECACGHRVGLNEYGMLDGCRFDTIRDLYAWQKTVVETDVAAGRAYCAANATLSAVQSHQEQKVADGPLSMTPQELRCGSWCMPLSEITDLAMHGQRKVVFTADHTYYELEILPGANALKYMLYYQALQQMVQ
jgi:1-acyl-sn-glycerol-3-phosphate acyltransferase